MSNDSIIKFISKPNGSCRQFPMNLSPFYNIYTEPQGTVINKIYDNDETPFAGNSNDIMLYEFQPYDVERIIDNMCTKAYKKIKYAKKLTPIVLNPNMEISSESSSESSSDSSIEVYIEESIDSTSESTSESTDEIIQPAITDEELFWNTINRLQWKNKSDGKVDKNIIANTLNNNVNEKTIVNMYNEYYEQLHIQLRISGIFGSHNINTDDKKKVIISHVIAMGRDVYNCIYSDSTMLDFLINAGECRSLHKYIKNLF